MPKQGKQGKGKPKMRDRDIGRALIRSREMATQQRAEDLRSGLAADREAGVNMISILDNDPLDDFIISAQMQGDEFEVQRVHKNDAYLAQPTTHSSLIMFTDTDGRNGAAAAGRKLQRYSTAEFQHEQLSIPRKPKWSRDMTAAEVDRNEKDAFLDWRRDIAAMEAAHDHQRKVTPFEKNLEVWRQLWRVCERSDIVVQIVDARNPLLYYTRDLMHYVAELQPPKPMVLLVNKADFLSAYQRQRWAEHFSSIGIRFAFYSAHDEQEKLDKLESRFVEKDPSQFMTAAARAKVNALADSLVLNWNGVAATTAVAATNVAATTDVAATDVAAIAVATDVAAIATGEVQSINAHDDINNEGNTHISRISSSAAATEALPSCLTDTAAAATAVVTAKGSRFNHFSALSDSEEDDEDDDNSNNNSNSNNNNNNNNSNNSNNSSSNEQEDNFESAAIAAAAEMSETSSKQQSTAAAAGRVHFADAVTASSVAVVSDEDNDDDASTDSQQLQQQWQQRAAAEEALVAATAAAAAAESAAAQVLTRAELLHLLLLLPLKMNISPQQKHDGRVCVGMVGYPNVGKSSVINTLLGVSKRTHGAVRVGVSSTPGKTKHFQTLLLSPQLMLCDCPGLVFPSFMNSTGEMICAGILPINQMRDHTEPASVVACRVPQYLLEAAFGMRVKRQLDPLDSINRPPTYAEMLAAYCEVKGLIAHGSGRWDEFRGCKEMLKAFTEGLILYVAQPPAAAATTTTTAAATTTTTTAAAASTTRGAATVGAGKEAADSMWLLETERIMMQHKKFAARMASNVVDRGQFTNATTAVNKNAAATAAAAAAAAVDEEDDEEENPRGEMVFGDGYTMKRQQQQQQQQAAAIATIPPAAAAAVVVTDGGYEYVEDSSSDDDSSDSNDADDNNSDNSEGEAGSTTQQQHQQQQPKREHKRVKQWGKKGRKLRGRTPYSDVDDDLNPARFVAHSMNRAPTKAGLVAKSPSITIASGSSGSGSSGTRSGGGSTAATAGGGGGTSASGPSSATTAAAGATAVAGAGLKR